MKPCPWVEHDGGRAEVGYRGSAGDCAVRSIAIVTDIAYQDVYDRINAIAKTERPRGKKKRSSAREGVHRPTMCKYVEGQLGFTWHPIMRIGQGCKIHLRSDELPSGRLIVSLSKHYAAVIDGVVYDTRDPSREGTRCVYGYWLAPNTLATD